MIDPTVFDGFPDFGDLAERDRVALAERMRATRFEKGQTLVRMLRPADRILLVLEGLAGLETVSVNGVRRIAWVFRPGDLIGARALLEEARTETSEVRALTDVQAAAIARGELERLAERHPEVWLAVTRNFTERWAGMADRLLAMTTRDVAVRLARLLLEFSGNGEDGDGFRPMVYSMTHETMAEIVGASRPHVSATLGEMEQRGAVRRGRGGKLAYHPATLQKIVEADGLGGI